ncbi:MAG: M14 family metallopeptidase [Lachnospiraceae bacterium]
MKHKKILPVITAAFALTCAVPAFASAVVGPGVGAPSSQNSGPGVVQSQPEPESDLPEIPGRIDYFTETVSNPVVRVVEKYSYDQMAQDIQSLSSRYGSKMQTNVIGTSLDGRNIYEIILGNPDAEKHILIHAGIHAREYMTPLLVMKQLEYGLEFYEQGSYEGQPLSNILDKVAIHYVPMVNPDGITLTQFGVDALHSEELRQAVMQCYSNDLSAGRTSAAFEQYLLYWKANARGVDLNQNFPANWELASTSALPSYAVYKGESALSEPESQALANLTLSRSWSATISYHSMGEVIYWDYTDNQVREASQELVNLIAATTGYRPAGSSGHGGYKDWTQIKEDPIPGLTIETGSVACPLPLSQYERIWHQNKMVWAAVAKYVMEH